MFNVLGADLNCKVKKECKCRHSMECILCENNIDNLDEDKYGCFFIQDNRSNFGKNIFKAILKRA